MLVMDTRRSGTKKEDQTSTVVVGAGPNPLNFVLTNKVFRAIATFFQRPENIEEQRTAPLHVLPNVELVGVGEALPSPNKILEAVRLEEVVASLSSSPSPKTTSDVTVAPKAEAPTGRVLEATLAA